MIFSLRYSSDLQKKNCCKCNNLKKLQVMYGSLMSLFIAQSATRKRSFVCWSIAKSIDPEKRYWRFCSLSFTFKTNLIDCIFIDCTKTATDSSSMVALSVFMWNYSNTLTYLLVQPVQIRRSTQISYLFW